MPKLGLRYLVVYLMEGADDPTMDLWLETDPHIFESWKVFWLRNSVLTKNNEVVFTRNYLKSQIGNKQGMNNLPNCKITRKEMRNIFGMTLLMFLYKHHLKVKQVLIKIQLKFPINLFPINLFPINLFPINLFPIN